MRYGCCSALDEIYFQAPEGGTHSSVPDIWEQPGGEVRHGVGGGSEEIQPDFSQGVCREVLCNIEGEQSSFPIPGS